MTVKKINVDTSYERDEDDMVTIRQHTGLGGVETTTMPQGSLYRYSEGMLHGLAPGRSAQVDNVRLTSGELARLVMDLPPECAYDQNAEHDMREVDHMMDGNNPDAVHECRECHACGETGCGR